MPPVTLSFDVGVIAVGPTAVLWGPYQFDLTSKIPDGDTISSAVVKTFLDDEDAEGRVGTDSSSGLVDTSSGTVSGVYVSAKFKYNATYKNTKHLVRLDVVFESGAKNSFYYGYVKVDP